MCTTNSVNFAAHHNLVFAENDFAIAVRYRSPVLHQGSNLFRSQAGRPYEHTDEEIRSISTIIPRSDLLQDEEWYYTPIDAGLKMPWHVLIKMARDRTGRFEGGTSIFINPEMPSNSRRGWCRVYKLRDEGKIGWYQRMCRVDPNPLNCCME